MKSYSHFLPVLAISVLCACSGGDEHLSESKMANLIVDLKLAEAYANSSYDYQSDSARNVLRIAVLEKHGVTQDQYDNSLRWYGHNMEQYTKLYERVEKLLDKKQGKLIAASSDVKNADKSESEQLWPYSAMAMLSPMSNSDAIQFSIPVSELDKGERIKWMMRLSKSVPVQITLGVDYADGATSYTTQRYSGQQRLEMNLQSDSTRTITRLYGYMRVDRKSVLPIWADSISLTHTPIISDKYYTFLSQSFYDGPTKRVVADSVKHRRPSVRPITAPTPETSAAQREIPSLKGEVPSSMIGNH